MNNNHNLCVLILVWNQIDKTIECLETLKAQSLRKFDVLIVDNGSDPPIKPFLEKSYEKLMFIRNDENLGFAGGINVGLRAILEHSYDTILLLNNDTLLAPSAIESLVEYLAAVPAAGAVSAKIYFANPPDLIWSVGSDIHPTLLEKANDQEGVKDDQVSFEKAAVIEFVPFCGLLVRREVFEQTGLLDETFFLYYEDLDYCLRLKAHNVSIHMNPHAKIWHQVSASSGGSESENAIYQLAKSSGIYFRKHGHGGRWALILPYRFMSALRKTARYIWKGNWIGVRALWRGLKAGWLSKLPT